MLAIIAVTLTAIFISIRYRVRSSVAAVPGIPAEGWRSEPVKPARTIRRWSGTVVVQRFRRDCDPGHDGTGIRHFVTTSQRAGVVLTKSRRCNAL
jgi:hypothetical protein